MFSYEYTNISTQFNKLIIIIYITTLGLLWLNTLFMADDISCKVFTTFYYVVLLKTFLNVHSLYIVKL